MKRRNFIKGAIALSSLGAISPALANVKLSEKSKTLLANNKNSRRLFVITQKYNLVPPKGSEGQTNLWIPIPENTSFQIVKSITFSGNYDKAFLTANNSYAAKTLFSSWSTSNKPMKIEVKMLIETLDWQPFLYENLDKWQLPIEEIVIPPEIQPYLSATPNVPTNGVVKETALMIIGDEKAPIKQAHLIHEWVRTHMYRDESVIGCGTGDVGEILKSGKLGGKCTDINSVFVALCRSCGIPAREMFGIRLGAPHKLEKYSKKAFGSADDHGVAKINTGQHCRAMFWLAGFGWVPADPADVTKMRLAEKKENNDPAVNAVSKYLFGNWEMNWVGFNYGRNFSLYPLTEQGDINNFGYPYAEVDGDPLNFYEPSEFSYDYVSAEQY